MHEADVVEDAIDLIALRDLCDHWRACRLITEVHRDEFGEGCGVIRQAASESDDLMAFLSKLNGGGVANAFASSGDDVGAHGVMLIDYLRQVKELTRYAPVSLASAWDRGIKLGGISHLRS